MHHHIIICDCIVMLHCHIAYRCRAQTPVISAMNDTLMHTSMFPRYGDKLFSMFMCLSSGWDCSGYFFLHKSCRLHLLRGKGPDWISRPKCRDWTTACLSRVGFRRTCRGDIMWGHVVVHLSLKHYIISDPHRSARLLSLMPSSKLPAISHADSLERGQPPGLSV